jgi:hypothetical protein
MNGTYSDKTKEAVAFVEELMKTVSVPVKTWDERLTSMQADKAMLEGDMSRAKTLQRALSIQPFHPGEAFILGTHGTIVMPSRYPLV